MTEEKRILYSRCGIGLCKRFNKWNLWSGIDKPAGCTPFAKDEISTIMQDLGHEAVRAFMVAQDLTNTYYKISVDNIDEDWFWEILCKPVPKQRYNVIVPHTKNDMYCKNDLGLSVVSDATDLDNCEFTEAEIKKYHLEDCKKELVDE